MSVSPDKSEIEGPHLAYTHDTILKINVNPCACVSVYIICIYNDCLVELKVGLIAFIHIMYIHNVMRLIFCVFKNSKIKKGKKCNNTLKKLL